MRKTWILMFAALTCLGSARRDAAAAYSWQQPHAKVLANGDLLWAPQPFVFKAGDSVRYIDFENGKDSNDGRTKTTPWKHHPWDPKAAAQAKACEGIHTYVFKRGVIYRGELIANESGEEGNPIRLTSDPTWGEGEAVLCGSEQITDWTMGADHPDIPNRLEVCQTDLDFAPRNVWMVEDDGTVVRIPLARTPNWTVSDPDDIKSEWWQWDNPKNVWGSRETVNGVESHIAFDTLHLTNSPDYYKDAYIWPEYGWVMSTPYPTRVIKYKPTERALVFGGQWSEQAGNYHIPRYARYYLEDKPHYLDEPGEFWFDKKGDGGRLYIRLPGDRDPHKVRVEVGKRLGMLDSEGMSHVHITALTFRFCNVYWHLDAPPTAHKDVDTACIRVIGSGEDVLIANCLFEHVYQPIRIKAGGDQDAIDKVVIQDNVFQYTDGGVLFVGDSGAWGMELPLGRLYDVKVLRNKLFQTGRRPNRYWQGHSIFLDCPQTAEIAGNIGHRLYASGIFVFGSKRSAAKVDRPLTRILIHHNKMTDTLLNNNDWGGIETWQGGPAYVFCNISGNPRGFKMWGHKITPDKPGTSSFGHAYYMDGGYKQYYFNNIAWGKSSNPYGPLGNCSAFQEIHGYQASVFNNTIYNFVIGSRRQAPEAGRNKYMGNIWHTIGEMVFRHARPSDKMADPNVADAGEAKSTFSLESNAYVDNLFYKVPENIGVFEPSGRWHPTVDSFRKALAEHKAIGNFGKKLEQPPLVAPERHDFRPTAAAIDKGVRVFVPWGLYATVGEWSFYPAGDDPTRIMDEHWNMTSHYVNREDYKKQPMYPLRGVNITAENYVEGPLEDWTRGALQLNGKDQYAVLTMEAMGAGEAKGEFEITNETYDWITFDAPDAISPDERFEATVTLTHPDPSLKISADLHWTRENGRFGGLNAWGGGAKDITGKGPYTFSFLPRNKPSLRNFTMTAWVSPTGGWKDQTAVARHNIAKGANAGAGGYQTVAVDTSSFLIEACFKTEEGETDCVVAEKLKETGYSLSVNEAGTLTFTVKGNGASRQLRGGTKINNGKWHHVVAEADRAAKTITVYVNGKPDVSGSGIGPDVSLANGGDLYVGGTPEGRCMAGAFEFLRIALGSLADSKTTIDELYLWQFGGPHKRDFIGRPPAGRRDAGAIEASGMAPVR